MRPVLRGAMSPDLMRLEDQHLPAGDVWCVYISLMIGADGELGEESFGVTVCSPEWLQAKIDERGGAPMVLRHYIIARAFVWPEIRSVVERSLAAIEGETWQDVALLVGRIGHWEFEDYRA